MRIFTRNQRAYAASALTSLFQNFSALRLKDQLGTFTANIYQILHVDSGFYLCRSRKFATYRIYMALTGNINGWGPRGRDVPPFWTGFGFDDINAI